MSKLGDLATESIIKINIDGESVDFVVIQQGIPSSDYDSSCDGTWVVLNVSVDSLSQAWDDAGSNDYQASSANDYLNNTVYNQLDDNIKKIVKQVKIPYVDGVGNAGTEMTGSNGLSTKLFLLSATEVGLVDAGIPIITAFSNSDLCYLRTSSGASIRYWYRDPDDGSNNEAYYWNVYNAAATAKVTTSYQLRFVMVLDPTAEVDESGNVTPGESAIGGYANIDGAYHELTDGYANIGGTWKEITGAYKNIGGTWKE